MDMLISILCVVGGLFVWIVTQRTVKKRAFILLSKKITASPPEKISTHRSKGNSYKEKTSTEYPSFLYKQSVFAGLGGNSRAFKP